MCYDSTSLSWRKEPNERFLENCISDTQHLVLCWHSAKINSFCSGAWRLHTGSMGTDHVAASPTPVMCKQPAFFFVMLYLLRSGGSELWCSGQSWAERRWCEWAERNVPRSLKLQGSHAWLKLLIFNRSASFGMIFWWSGTLLSEHADNVFWHFWLLRDS